MYVMAVVQTLSNALAENENDNRLDKDDSKRETADSQSCLQLSYHPYNAACKQTCKYTFRLTKATLCNQSHPMRIK